MYDVTLKPNHVFLETSTSQACTQLTSAGCSSTPVPSHMGGGGSLGVKGIPSHNPMAAIISYGCLVDQGKDACYMCCSGAMDHMTLPIVKYNPTPGFQITGYTVANDRPFPLTNFKLLRVLLPGFHSL